jgi:hypothetical protein
MLNRFVCKYVKERLLLLWGAESNRLRCENHLAPLPAVSQHPYPQIIIINVKP